MCIRGHAIVAKVYPQMSSSTNNRRKLSVKQLESYLQELDEFESPKLGLEQYATPPHIAAMILNTIDLTYNDLDGKFVADLGCGTGRLSLGSVMCGAQMVFGVDIDRKAIECGLKNVIDIFGEDDDDDVDNDNDNIQNLGLRAYKACEKVNFIQADITQPDSDGSLQLLGKKFDTVVMNPPFGTKNNAGLDMIFLKRAIELTDGSVYSLHKSSTRDFILGNCKRWAVEGKPVVQIRYNLDNTYKFHKRKSVDIDVDLWRIICSPRQDQLQD